MLTLRGLMAVAGIMVLAAALDRCTAMAAPGAMLRIPASFVVEKTDMTEFSARRRKRSGRSRRAAVVAADPPPGVEYERPDPDRFVVKPNDPLLTSYWPPLEAPPEADQLPTAITIPSWPIAPPAPPKEAWAYTSAGKTTLVTGTLGLVAGFVMYLVLPIGVFGGACRWARWRIARF